MMQLQWSIWLCAVFGVTGTHLQDVPTTSVGPTDTVSKVTTMTPGVKNENDTTTNHSLEHRGNVSHLQSDSVSSPYWILLVTPGCALVLGVFLFTLTLVLYQRYERRERAAREKRMADAKQKSCRSHCYNSYWDGAMVNGLSTVFTGGSVDNLSYENVEVAVYNQQSPKPLQDLNEDYLVPDNEVTDGEKEGGRGNGVRICVSLYHTQKGADQDYVAPEEEGEEEGRGQPGQLHVFQNDLDTDGESYENMESSVISGLSRNGAPHRTHSGTDCEEEEDGESYENMQSSVFSRTGTTPRTYSEGEEDYIVPEEEGGREGGGQLSLNPPQNDPDTDTVSDGESYENMESSVYSEPFRHGAPPRTHTGTDCEEEEDSYEKMDCFPSPGPERVGAENWPHT
ncbi:uncharacterized protein LOC136767862 isoform X2 [Amia ocellicauda]|uniref:uncharacterized protein LOC136767862 isoform X2 n=1 Tax=Amia ocellicauda TaxID=2972642 RepID=UPI003463F8F4